MDYSTIKYKIFQFFGQYIYLSLLPRQAAFFERPFTFNCYASLDSGCGQALEIVTIITTSPCVEAAENTLCKPAHNIFSLPKINVLIDPGITVKSKPSNISRVSCLKLMCSLIPGSQSNQNLPISPGFH